MRDKKSGFFLFNHFRLLIAFSFVLIAGCKGCFEKIPDWTEYLVDQKGAVLSPTPEKQLIVFLKPGTDRTAFNKFLYSDFVNRKDSSGNSIPKDSALKIISVCGSCDSSLLLLEGSGVEAFINGEVAKGGSSSKIVPKLSGENDLLYFTTNKSISFDALPGTSFRKSDSGNINYEDSVTLAVFDTGVDPDLFQGYLVDTLPATPCIPDAVNGWNFYSWSNNWKDDNTGLHGTIVSRFIINEVQQYRKTKVNILPVKVFNAEGMADLYTILCGFAYASHSGANIVNASFGFYESKIKFKNGEPSGDTTTSALLQNFIDGYLAQKNILLVCAAGNKSDEDSTIRNLDEVNFYPASLASSLPNIIPVTTVGDTGKGRVVSPNQNFSSSIVQLGVDADFIEGDHFGFINPIDLNSNITIAGSSFASPIAAGKLASNFYIYKQLLTPAGIISFGIRDSIFNLLYRQENPFLQIDSALSGKVNNGKVITRNNNVAQNKSRKFIRGIEDRGLRIIRK